MDISIKDLGRCKKELLVALRRKEPTIAEVKFRPGAKGRKKGSSA